MIIRQSVRPFFFILVFVWIPFCRTDDIGNANDYIDEVLTNLRKEPFVLSKLDPIDIPDVEEKNFQVKEGQIRGLGSLYRHGDCTLAYDGKIVNVSAEVAVRDVTIDVKYRAKALFFWINGHANVVVEHLAVKMDVSGKDGKANLDSFKVTHLGDYKVKKITGMSVVLNWLLKLIANAVAKKSRGKIIDAMENGVSSTVSDLLNKYQLPNLGNY